MRNNVCFLSVYAPAVLVALVFCLYVCSKRKHLPKLLSCWTWSFDISHLCEEHFKYTLTNDNDLSPTFENEWSYRFLMLAIAYGLMDQRV